MQLMGSIFIEGTTEITRIMFVFFLIKVVTNSWFPHSLSMLSCIVWSIHWLHPWMPFLALNYYWTLWWSSTYYFVIINALSVLFGWGSLQSWLTIFSFLVYIWSHSSQSALSSTLSTKWWTPLKLLLSSAYILFFKHISIIYSIIDTLISVIFKVLINFLALNFSLLSFYFLLPFLLFSLLSLRWFSFLSIELLL